MIANLHPLTVLTLFPLIAGLVLIGIGKEKIVLARTLGFCASLASLIFCILLWRHFDAGSGELQFVEQKEWIPSLAVQYHLGVDGLGLLMLLLTAIVTPMAMLASMKLGERVPLYFALVLFLEAGLFGTFTALNFVHWFLFWELSLIPAFFLIKLWGGTGRSSAATQFFVYTMVGSIALLLAFLAIFLATGKFDFTELAEIGRNGTLASAFSVRLGWFSLSERTLALVIFGGAFLGFAVKVPLIPFHTWLPTTYSEAPTGTTMLLTGVMSKMGVYGFIRVLLPIFPEQMQWVLSGLLWLAVITIVYSAGAAFAQRDLKRILAYSSINHLGYCMLGIFAAARFTGADAGLANEKAAALNGVFLQMFNHGLTAATLFWFVGFLQERAGGLRGIDDFGGLRRTAPILCGLMGIALFSSLGLPGLNGFVGEFLIFKGVFPLATWATALSLLGLLITAIFLLTLLQRVFTGPLSARSKDMPDLSFGERILILPPIVLMFALGLYPQVILGFINQSVIQMVERMQP
jgi:NADH-quinone oxidoreductase subunit M